MIISKKDNNNNYNNKDNKYDETMAKNKWTVSKLTKLINHNDKQ